MSRRDTSRAYMQVLFRTRLGGCWVLQIVDTRTTANVSP